MILVFKVRKIVAIECFDFCKKILAKIDILGLQKKPNNKIIVIKNKIELGHKIGNTTNIVYLIFKRYWITIFPDYYSYLYRY
jgi:hypothetical protein